MGEGRARPLQGDGGFPSEGAEGKLLSLLGAGGARGA